MAALKTFIERFDFVGDPLDIALRKLLLEIGLPKETQQIDRVMEGFADRYIQCNPDLYVSKGMFLLMLFPRIKITLLARSSLYFSIQSNYAPYGRFQ